MQFHDVLCCYGHMLVCTVHCTQVHEYTINVLCTKGQNEKKRKEEEWNHSIRPRTWSRLFAISWWVKLTFFIFILCVHLYASIHTIRKHTRSHIHFSLQVHAPAFQFVHLLNVCVYAPVRAYVCVCVKEKNRAKPNTNNSERILLNEKTWRYLFTCVAFVCIYSCCLDDCGSDISNIIIILNKMKYRCVCHLWAQGSYSINYTTNGLFIYVLECKRQ